MDRVDVMQLFVKVVETGSFSKAAQAMGIGQPAVSKQIAALEMRLGAQLLRRTSRGLDLTGAGQSFYESTIELLSDLEAAESRIGHGHATPSGLVRVALSAGIGRMYVVPRLPEFFAAFPDVAIDIDVSELHVNLIEDRIDVAIRIGQLSDSTLLARKLGQMEFATVASPAYLAAAGVPARPADLERHATLGYVFRGAPRDWEYQGPDGATTIVPKGPILTNDLEHIRAGVLAGLGFAHNSRWLFAQDILDDKVTQLFQAHEPAPLPINAVWAGGRRLPGRVKVFIEFLAKIFAEHHAPK